MGNMRKNFRSGSIFAFSVLFLLVQTNISVASFKRESAQKRLEQYGEIMNSKKKKLVSKDHLYETVHSKVQRSLPKKHKAQAKRIAREVIAQSEKFKMDPLFLLAVIETESSFNPDSVGPVGELGMMQLRSTTGAWIAEKYGITFKGDADLKNPVKNIRLGAAYLDYLRHKFDKSAVSYISAYNMGPKNVRRLAQEQVVPQIYSSKVIKHYVSIHDLLQKRESQNSQIKTAEKVAKAASQQPQQDIEIIEL